MFCRNTIIISIHTPQRGATNIVWDFCIDVIFQSTPLNEGRQPQRTGTMSGTLFQSTPLNEGRPCYHPITIVNFFISIHTPQRGATHGGLPDDTGGHYFNPHPSTRGDIGMLEFLAFGKNFNPHPSTRGDRPSHSCWPHQSGISIHTPQRGATRRSRRSWPLRWISIHTPQRGATKTTNGIDNIMGFQSTPLNEGRRDFIPPYKVRLDISIHTPQRGAT